MNNQKPVTSIAALIPASNVSRNLLEVQHRTQEEPPKSKRDRPNVTKGPGNESELLRRVDCVKSADEARQRNFINYLSVTLWSRPFPGIARERYLLCISCAEPQKPGGYEECWKRDVNGGSTRSGAGIGLTIALPSAPVSDEVEKNRARRRAKRDRPCKRGGHLYLPMKNEKPRDPQ